MIGTFWALVPAIVAIALALWTKEVYSSLFIGIVLGALFYAIENFGFDLSEDEIFNNFVAENGYWWIATYIGNSKAEELEREFFDRYFPILKKRLSKEHNTAD